MSFIGKNIKKIRTVKKLSQAAFAELFSLARPSVGAYEEGRSEPKIETIIAMANHFGLSTDALLRKELSVNELYSLDILKGDFDPTQMPPALGKSSGQSKEISTATISVQSPAHQSGVPLIERETTLEYIVNISNRDFIGKLPTISLPQSGKKLQRAFTHTGQEMFHNECGLHQGDILLCNQRDKEKPTELKPENVYVLVTSQHIFTRRLLSATESAFELKADNPAYENIRLNLDEILEIWEVEGVWSQQLRPPAFLESRIMQLENRLAGLEEKLNSLQQQ